MWSEQLKPFPIIFRDSFFYYLLAGSTETMTDFFVVKNSVIAEMGETKHSQFLLEVFVQDVMELSRMKGDRRERFFATMKTSI